MTASGDRSHRRQAVPEVRIGPRRSWSPHLHPPRSPSGPMLPRTSTPTGRNPPVDDDELRLGEVAASAGEGSEVVDRQTKLASTVVTGAITTQVPDDIAPLVHAADNNIDRRGGHPPWQQPWWRGLGSFPAVTQSMPGQTGAAMGDDRDRDTDQPGTDWVHKQK